MLNAVKIYGADVSTVTDFIYDGQVHLASSAIVYRHATGKMKTKSSA